MTFKIKKIEKLYNKTVCHAPAQAVKCEQRTLTLYLRYGVCGGSGERSVLGGGGWKVRGGV